MLEQKPQIKTNKQEDKVELPPIPDKLYFTIGEVSKLCLLEAHVLRYWEQEFPQLKPSKRSGNRRYYLAKDITLIRCIKDLLYKDGYTIEGARTFLAKKGSSNKRPEHYTLELTNRVLTKLEKLLDEINAEEVMENE